MPRAMVSDTQVSYEVYGSGEPVLLIPPAGTGAMVWQTHQVPALLRAGYQVVTMDNRGTPPSSVPPAPYSIADLVADTADLIDGLGLAPCRVVGASLGAMVAQELALARPDLVTAACLLGTRCRTDFFRGALARTQAALALKPADAHTDYEALGSMMYLFSARTLADDQVASDWYAIFRKFPVRGVGAAAQYEATLIADRGAALRGSRRPCLVIGFGEDALTPPAFCREVAAAIPGGRYVEIPDCGHFGFLENPDAVNAVILEFFRQEGNEN